MLVLRSVQCLLLEMKDHTRFEVTAEYTRPGCRLAKPTTQHKQNTADLVPLNTPDICCHGLSCFGFCNGASGDARVLCTAPPREDATTTVDHTLSEAEPSLLELTAPSATLPFCLKALPGSPLASSLCKAVAGKHQHVGNCDVVSTMKVPQSLFMFIGYNVNRRNWSKLHKHCMRDHSLQQADNVDWLNRCVH